MKGISAESAFNDGMNNKPIVTCAGDWNLFCTLEAALSAALPQDTCEWRRSHGRAPRSVRLEAAFVKRAAPAAAAAAPDHASTLLQRPIFHIYWTDCVDIESFKTTLKDDIEQWLKELAQKEITDWMVVLVETYDMRRTNKLLPRTTVLDKIKGEFANKLNEDRFISVINPIKSECRSAESWRGLVARVRHFILAAYNKTLHKFEEHMREQREKRIEPEWDYTDYFLLQEQLALVLETLGLYEEALVQYDELDALFTQYVLNSCGTAAPRWLGGFRRAPAAWRAPRLGPRLPVRLRELLARRQATLLDFRSYLYQRQSAMLLLQFKPWEMAERCVSTVHSTTRQLELLEVPVPEGAAACWALLTCAETLRTCERLLAGAEVPRSAVELCTARLAPLAHLAKDKLYSLGGPCGLLPGSPPPTSQQLHLVVMLSAGMGDSEPARQPDATERLREALGGGRAFQQYYLELAELALGTYKHIGRLRFARFIGLELARFYSDLGDTTKAAVFLTDALRSYEEQGWRELAAHTRLELVACANKCGDMERYTKLSATIASSAELEILVRNFYFDEMMKSIKKNLADRTETVLAELSDCFKVISASLVPSEREVYITDNKVQCRLVIESYLPREIMCNRAAISIESCKEQGDRQTDRGTPVKGQGLKTDSNISTRGNSPRRTKETTDESNSVVSSIRLDDLKPKNPLLNPLSMTAQLHYKEDRTLDRATVECQNPKATLKRSDSSKYRKPSSTIRNDYTTAMSCVNFLLKPGLNDVCVECVAKRDGTFKLGQISLVVEEKLEYLSNALVVAKVGFEVVVQGVNVYLNKIDPKKDLVAGLEHTMELVVTSGSSHIEENMTVTLKTSAGLGICFESDVGREMSRSLAVPVPPLRPFQTSRVPLRLLAALPSKRDKERSIEHTVWLQCPWWASATEVPLQFSPPLQLAHRLLTSHARKFLHVTLRCRQRPAGDRGVRLALTRPALSARTHAGRPVQVSCLNPAPERPLIVSSDGMTASYMWELQSDPLVRAEPLKASFEVGYRLLESDEPERDYSCPLDVQDYTTLFVIRTRLDPVKGSEFCRASQMCHLQLTVQRVNETEHTSLMYEVLADQTMWAVCGRTAGVIGVESEREAPVTLDVMPLVAGYLPLPAVRLSKYIAAATKDRKEPGSANPRLEPFSPGQVYHAGKALQVHVLAPLPKELAD